jgi:hypothetical protein
MSQVYAWFNFLLNFFKTLSSFFLVLLNLLFTWKICKKERNLSSALCVHVHDVILNKQQSSQSIIKHTLCRAFPQCFFRSLLLVLTLTQRYQKSGSEQYSLVFVALARDIREWEYMKELQQNSTFYLFNFWVSRCIKIIIFNETEVVLLHGTIFQLLHICRFKVFLRSMIFFNTKKVFHYHHDF